ncbi:dipeptide ABC transporter ATP-binding protein [Amycolatopsis panacis]|uniref:ABC transporter ATP-binding protein n=1 Tax=Amycolatopsis panacis TaxID=2340917 RepID=A0A419I4R9_9PSEU|nr:ABC transporter ATP-binding protein [Amycolatopsis panacis]RJQ85458.1 ABC transporter ATP-binding protein [Amycolatopsis panacis]
MNAALTVSGLTVGYSSRGRLTEAVTDIGFEIPAGGRVGLVGESGSGKTTVAMAILNYLPRNATILGGAIEFDGRNLLEVSTAELTAMRGRRIAAVYQDPGSSLNPTIPIGRQVGEVFELHLGMDRRESRQAAVAALDRVQLPSPERVATRYPHELSGGQQQRVMIAMALAASPSLLLLDEPTTGLDATVEAGVIELIEELSRDTGTALLMVSHNLPLVRHLCEDAVVMRAGRVVEAGPTATLLRTPGEEYTRGLVASVPTRSHRKFTNVVRAAGEAAREVPPRRLDEIAALADSEDIVLSIKDLVKKYDTNEGVVHAIRGVDLDMRRGEILAIVGESGSGKSTLAKCVVGLESFSSGSIVLDGTEMPRNHRRRDRSAAARRPTLVFQNPETSLNPTKTARAVLRQALRLGGEDPAKVDAIGAETQLTERHLDSKTRRLSGGLKQRVAIARASAGGPAIVVCDEPVSALDVSVQAGILNLLAQRQAEAGASYLFISHDLDVVHYLADSVAVMYMGEIVERGTAEAVFAAPHHPYTAALMSASVSAEGERIRLQGQAPSAYRESAGCIFAGRCPVALDDGSCSTTTPPWREGPGEKQYRCHRTPEELVLEPAVHPAVPSGSL